MAFERSLVVMTPEESAGEIWTDLERRHRRSQFQWSRINRLRLWDIKELKQSEVIARDDPRTQLMLRRRDEIGRMEKVLLGLVDKLEIIKQDACTGDSEGSRKALDDARTITNNLLSMQFQIQKHQEQMQKQLDAYQDDISKESKLIGGLLTAATELVAKQKMHREKLDQAKDLHQLPTEELQRILGEMDSKIESVSEKVAGAEMLVLEDLPEDDPLPSDKE